MILPDQLNISHTPARTLGQGSGDLCIDKIRGRRIGKDWDIAGVVIYSCRHFICSVLVSLVILDESNEI